MNIIAPAERLLLQSAGGRPGTALTQENVILETTKMSYCDHDDLHAGLADHMHRFLNRDGFLSSCLPAANLDTLFRWINQRNKSQKDVSVLREIRLFGAVACGLGLPYDPKRQVNHLPVRVVHVRHILIFVELQHCKTKHSLAWTPVSTGRQVDEESIEVSPLPPKEL